MLERDKMNDDQKKVMDAKGNVLVSASAGSGKTTVMIAKIIDLILQGKDVKRMAVMTFSKAAAADMKNKLVNELYGLLRTGKGGSHVREQLEAFPFANICTIDSFCFGLVKKYFATAGADPSAKVTDPEDSAVMFSECMDLACEKKLSSGDKAFISLAERYTTARRLDDLKKNIELLRNFLLVQPDREKFLEEDFSENIENYVFDYFVKYTKKIYASCLSLLPLFAAVSMDEEKAETEKAAEILRKAKEADTLQKFLYVTSFLSEPKLCRKSKGISLEIKSRYNGFRSEVSDYADKCRYFADLYARKGNALNEDVKKLAEVTLLTMQLYDERKKREGKIDFSDMGIMAKKVLSDEKVRKEVVSSFDYIFVDEYQDTNYLQENLINAFSNGDNVFVVGDVKQAIYHFRYAEPQIFLERMRRYETDGENVPLNENYRSRKEILDFVNAVCAEVMTEEFCSVDYRGENMMKAGAEFGTENPAAEIYLYDKEEKERENVSGIYSVKDAPLSEEADPESTFTAKLIKEKVACRTPVYRPSEKKYSPLRYGDVAVLAATGKGCRKIAAALAAEGVPYSVAEPPEGIFAPRELLVDFIRLCVSSSDVTVVNVLMSPVFGFSYSELLEIRLQSPKTSFWEALKMYNGDENLRKKAERFVTYAEKLRVKSSYTPVSVLMTEVLADGLDAYFLSLGNEVASRIYRFLQNVAALEGDRGAEDFLIFYESSYKGEKPPSGADSVTVMTMHKSKGLEFPWVILPFAHTQSVGEKGFSSALYTDRELGIALRSSESESGTTDDNFFTAAHKMKKREEERKELARLMYVAFTRAKNRLIVTGKRKKVCTDLDEAVSIEDFLTYATAKNPLLKSYYAEAVFTNAEKSAKTNIPRALKADFSYLEQPYAYSESTVLPNKSSVSEILDKEERTVSRFRYEGTEASLGTAYHLLLQKIDLKANDEEKVKREIDALVAEGELPEDAARKVDCGKVAELLNSDLMRIAAQGKCHREIPFVYYLPVVGEDRTLIQGVADLVIEEDDSLTVVDYKASNAPPEILSERYAKQLEIYSSAMEKIFSKPVKGRILFNILRNYTVDV